jgi:hypothetical protein
MLLPQKGFPDIVCNSSGMNCNHNWRKAHYAVPEIAGPIPLDQHGLSEKFGMHSFHLPFVLPVQLLHLD